MKKSKNKLIMENVSVGSWGGCKKYGEGFRYNPEVEEKLRPYVENNCLKTDIDSLTKVAQVLDEWGSDMVVVNSDGTITFYDGDY